MVAERRLAGAADAAAAVEAAAARLSRLGRPAGGRARSVLLAAAAELRERRAELAALMVRECAKPWAEADADVCEAIDFLEYYALAAPALERGPELAQVPGERNTMRYAPRGVVAVISPWNFPLAIPTGMTAAGLAAGNAVVLKPAEQSPGCALALVRALHARAFRPTRWRSCPARPRPAGALVRAPGRALIAFTGSGAVGPGHRRAAAARDARGAGSREARGGRDGRQELRDRGLRRRPGRGRAGHGGVGVRATRARSARPARACWSTRRCTSHLVERLAGRGRGAARWGRRSDSPPRCRR